MRKDYRIIYKQKYMGEELQDSYVKYNATIAEMDQAISDLYSDSCVCSARYECLEESK